jgi:hypothetical protein
MRLTVFILFILTLPACEQYSEPSEPVLFMGGGKWTLVRYDIVLVSSITPLRFIKNDTICINSFGETRETSEGIVMKQAYFSTPASRRFIVNKTQWEFDGCNLYCDWVFTPGGMKPAGEPMWVTYPHSYYTNYTVMSVFDTYTGSKTDYTFLTNNTGVFPPNELILMSPNIVINLYSSSGARDKAVTLKVVLTFIR